MMNIKKIITYFIVVGLFCFAGYLTFDMVSTDVAQQKDVQNYCKENCGYNPSSMFWEFSGGNALKGFTTGEECFSYCSKVKNGFAYNLVVGSYASLMSSPLMSGFLNLFHSK